MSRLFLSPVEAGPIDDLAPQRRYDALLASVGYEVRGRRAAEALAPSGTVITGVEFTHGHDHRYEANRRAYDELGSRVLRIDDRHYGVWVLDWLEREVAGGSRSFAVDVSSMSRPRIGGIVSAVKSLAAAADITVDFLYVPAKFEPPPLAADVTEALEPATPAFAGDPLSPDRELLLVFGLGYEPEWAAAAIDEFSPEQTLVFFPHGRDARFEKAVAAANEPVFALPKVGEPIRYPVDDPFRTFAEVDATVREALRRQMRPLLLPLGPKIFAVVCFLVAVSGHTVVPVWRVSSGRFAEAPDRVPDDQLVTLRVATRPLRQAALA